MKLRIVFAVAATALMLFVLLPRPKLRSLPVERVRPATPVHKAVPESPMPALKPPSPMGASSNKTDGAGIAQKVRWIECIVYQYEGSALNVQLRNEAERLLIQIFNAGTAPNVLAVIGLLKHFPDLAIDSRRAIAEGICRFQRQDLVFELIKGQLRRPSRTAPIIDLSACNG